MALVDVQQVPGPTSRLHQYFGVRATSASASVQEFQGLSPLYKPSHNSRGVFGGNLCAQSLVAAMETAPQGFVPHSLHSYFVSAGCDKTTCAYEVERLSDGKVFCNRLVRVSQHGVLKYVVMVSLTNKNSTKEARARFEASGRGQSGFEFQAPVNSTFYDYPLEDLPTVTDYDYGKLLHHKFPPNFCDENVAGNEHAKPAAERDLSFWARVNDDCPDDAKFRYAGFGSMSDSIYLTSLSRILHMPAHKDDPRMPIGPTGGKNDHFFAVSLDHAIYFHDDDFNPTDWVFVNFKTPRFSNNRVYVQAGYYNREGKLFASIVQEGLVLFHGGSEFKAKL
ncbi:hypothetical protein DICA3_F26940 [Diutina catenulata]